MIDRWTDHPTRWCVVALLVITSFITWPQLIHFHQVTDFGDPLLNSWVLAWDAHAMVSQPLHFFDANIFFPSQRTLLYSEPLILPGLVLAPLSWMHLDPIAVHNVLLFTGYIASGTAIFILVRSLQSDVVVAFVAAVIFTVHPYRTEIYPKVQLQLIFWVPLALAALHRLLVSGRRGDAVWLGLLLAAQAYTCIYYGVFGPIAVATVACVLVIASGKQPRHTFVSLGIAALISIISVAPLWLAYTRTSEQVGERGLQEIQTFSATLQDYRQPHPDNWLYGNEARKGHNERRLFPGVTVTILAVIGALSPGSRRTKSAYLALSAVALELSLGTNGVAYDWMFHHIQPLRGLRVPARFAMLVALGMSVLAAYGVASLRTWIRQPIRRIVTCALLVVVVIEGRNRVSEFADFPDRTPVVYRWLAVQPRGVVCEYPLGDVSGRIGPQDPTYEYYSTRHWMPLVNGYSGFEPQSYTQLEGVLHSLSGDSAIAALKARHVRYLLVHSAFYITGDYAGDVAALQRRRDVSYIGSFPWRDGSWTSAFSIP